jgi:two-component system sensor histidine kinase UhpB
MDISEHKAASRALENAYKRLKLLSGRILNAQEIERRSIANELHDEIGQALTAVKFKLHGLSRRFLDESAAAQIAAGLEITDLALQQVRNLSLNLRPPQLELMGLEAALRWLLVSRCEGTGIKSHFSAHLMSEGRDEQIDITCFRLVQEALTNAIRHAHAENLWVDVVQTTREIELLIRDDGVGFDYEHARAKAAEGASIGLLSMEERVILLQGSIDIVARSGGGTAICARIPLAAEVTLARSEAGGV